MKGNYFSIVIPTMWKSNLLETMINVYDKSEFVKEVIIIDNEPKLSREVLSWKTRKFTKGKNIFVNPAWNWGAELSNYNLILANDDIFIPDLDGILKLILDSNFDIVGLKTGRANGEMDIIQVEKFPRNSYGCFMYIKNYIKIPEQLKIWYGDRILFYHNKKRGLLINSGLSTQSGTTINSDRNYFRNKIGKNDIREFAKLKFE